MKMFKRNTLPLQAFKCLLFRHSFRGNWDWKWHLEIKFRTCKKYLRATRFHIGAGGSKSAEKYQLTSKFAFYYFEVIIRNFFGSLLVVVGRRREYENVDSVTRYTSLQKPRQRFNS